MNNEDCATVLEQFVHDVANLPAEITHLMEEVQAKDKIIQECRTTINSRDSSIQKFIKLNGSLAPNPKEEQYSKTILQNLDRCQALQDEKIQLSEKACVLLDRQIKKLDAKIRDLVNEGILTNDPPLPSLLDGNNNNNNNNRYDELPPAFSSDFTPSSDITPTSTTTSSYTPLNPTSGNAINITSSSAAAVAQRINQANSRASAANSLLAATSQQAPHHHRNSAPSTPTAAALHLQQRQRESSAGAVDSKRRRLNASLGTLPAAPSNLRQSSLGPGTPKAGGTPAASRAGSAGPRGAGGGVATKKAATKKVAPHQQVKKIKAGSGKLVKRSSSVGTRVKHGHNKKSPSAVEGDEDDDDSMLSSSADVSESENASVSRRMTRGLPLDSDDELEDDEDEGGEDTKVYCTCRSVSHGDMVACDNDNCPYEWFHWKCVGLTREPLGTWYCAECRQTLGK